MIMSVSKNSGGKVTCRKKIDCSAYKGAVESTRYTQNSDGTLGEPVPGSNSIGSAIGASTPDINSDAVETLSDYVNNGLYGNSGGVHNLPTHLRPLEPGECIKPIVSNCPSFTMDFETTANDPDSNGLSGLSMDGGGGPLSLGFEIVSDCD
jgi:hypothetical protein